MAPPWILMFVAVVPLTIAQTINTPSYSADHHGSVQTGEFKPVPVLSRNAASTSYSSSNLQESRANDEHMVINSDGQYSFSYTAENSARAERRNLDGSVEGKYSYTDPSGKLVEIQYTADANGYNAQGDDVPPRHVALPPYPVLDTPQVAEARAKFLAYYQREWDARKALEAIENATATTPILNSTLSSLGTDKVDEEQEDVVVQQFSSSQEISKTTTDPRQEDSYESSDDSAEIVSVNDPLSNIAPYSGPGQASQSSITAQKQGTEKVALPSAEYSLQYEVGNVPFRPSSDKPGDLLDAVMLKSTNKVRGPAYFYYVGAGGLPYYVTSLPTRSNVAVSVRASQLGAIPAAAIHDVQTRHYGGSVLRPKPAPPIYVEVQRDYNDEQNSHQFGANSGYTFRTADQSSNYNKVNNHVVSYPAGFPFRGYPIFSY